MHHRLAPEKHRFHYNIYMFYLDLEEIGMLAKRLRWLSYNRFNLFNFRDKDHLQLPIDGPDRSKDVREQIVSYLQTRHIHIGKGRIRLLTNLCTLGYQFNPVSFYFCFDEEDRPLCTVAEVGNTFGEMKPYFLGRESLSNGGSRFRMTIPKYFYVSPFTDMDAHFDFDLAVPGERLYIRIDDRDQEGKRFFISTLTGDRKKLTDSSLLRYFFSIPLVTLKVIAGIHWEALRLWLKKVPYHKKEAHKDLQREVYRLKQ
jgi:DUF1365 family protein